MSFTARLVASAIGAGAILATPASAQTHVHHHAGSAARYALPQDHAWDRAFGGAGYYVTHVPPGPHTGYKYFGPYNKRIVTEPNGTVLGTDPDPNIRAYMHHDNVGANVPGGGGLGR